MKLTIDTTISSSEAKDKKKSSMRYCEHKGNCKNFEYGIKGCTELDDPTDCHEPKVELKNQHLYYVKCWPFNYITTVARYRSTSEKPWLVVGSGEPQGNDNITVLAEVPPYNEE